MFVAPDPPYNEVIVILVVLDKTVLLITKRKNSANLSRPVPIVAPITTSLKEKSIIAASLSAMCVGNS